MNTPTLTDQISSSADEYAKLLERLDQTTDRLQSSLQDWNEQQVMHLLAEREDLFSGPAGLAETRKRLRLLLEEVRDCGSAELRVFDSVVEWLTGQEKSMIEKQRACESALTSALQDCKTDLAGFSMRRGVKAAYCRPAGTRNACFIDNRL